VEVESQYGAEVEQRHSVRGAGVDALLVQVKSATCQPACFQKASQRFEGLSDRVDPEDQHLLHCWAMQSSSD
jgi:hypothetical protein